MKKIKVERNYADFLVRTGKNNYKYDGTPDEKFAVLLVPDAEAINLLRKGGNIIDVTEEPKPTSTEQTKAE